MDLDSDRKDSGDRPSLDTDNPTMHCAWILEFNLVKIVMVDLKNNLPFSSFTVWVIIVPIEIMQW